MTRQDCLVQSVHRKRSSSVSMPASTSPPIMLILGGLLRQRRPAWWFRDQGSPQTQACQRFERNRDPAKSFARSHLSRQGCPPAPHAPRFGAAQHRGCQHRRHQRHPFPAPEPPPSAAGASQTWSPPRQNRQHPQAEAPANWQGELAACGAHPAALDWPGSAQCCCWVAGATHSSHMDG